MSHVQLSLAISAPPPGSVNVRFGKSIEGPGGRWVPCVTQVADGLFCSSLFEVGPGRRQVCAATSRFHCADQALQSAIELASTAAA
jgi:hypothetical protein